MQLITHLTNIRYLTGFTGSSGFLLVGKSKNYFFTDFRYQKIAEKLSKSKTRLPFEFVLMDKDFRETLNKCTSRVKTIEFESAHLSVDQLKSWKKRFKGKKLVPAKSITETKRLQKDKNEIRYMKQSQKINEQTLTEIKKLLKPGLTEQEIAWKIKVIGHDFGAEDISFEPIVAFGANSAVPHHQNTRKKLKKSDIVLIDMGMKYKGYCSDMTRTFLPKKPSALQVEVYQKVLDAQKAAIKAVKSGVKVAKLDQIARDSMGEFAEYFGHSLGHGIGLDVHESPGVSTRSKEVLKENMVVTMEPGIYLPGKFGVRIEDMGRVTQSAYDNFTNFTK
jgi:Xaa-Pro aminopeptidase